MNTKIPASPEEKAAGFGSQPRDQAHRTETEIGDNGNRHGATY